MKAMVMGSFDPITLGHLYIIEQAIAKYDDLTVCVMVNENKEKFFNLQQRAEMLELVLPKYVKIDTHEGMCYEYCKQNGIEIIVRGFRNNDDYLYETEMAEFNKENCGVDTVLISASENLFEVSGSVVRKAIKNHSDLSELLPTIIVDYIHTVTSEK